MNELINTPSGGEMPAKMGSKEIADVCEKRHDHVIRDIRAMISALGDSPELGNVEEVKDSRGYTKEFLLPKDLTLTLVSGYDIQLRHRIVKRLEQYEASRPPAPSVIDMRDISQLRIAAVQLIEMNQEKDVRIAELTPKAEALDRLECSEGSVGPRLAAKMLSIKKNDSPRTHYSGRYGSGREGGEEARH